MTTEAPGQKESDGADPASLLRAHSRMNNRLEKAKPVNREKEEYDAGHVGKTGGLRSWQPEKDAVMLHKMVLKAGRLFRGEVSEYESVQRGSPEDAGARVDFMEAAFSAGQEMVDCSPGAEYKLLQCGFEKTDVSVSMNIVIKPPV